MTVELQPRVSVVMGVYNGQAALAASVRSILSQDEPDLEFVIVNDGSRDDSPALLDDFARADSRVRVIHQENAGLTAALATGCQIAQGRYIARQDVGDLSRPGRLKRQADFLDAHPAVALVCPGVELLAPGGELLDVLLGPDDPAAATRQLVDEGRAPIHTAVMFRRDAYLAAGGYRTEFRAAQDHDLWYRLIAHGQIAFIPQPLFAWVLDETGISATGRARQQRFAELARAAYFARQRGESEQPLLDEARQLAQSSTSTPAPTESDRRATAARNVAATCYFVGSRLAARRDSRCRRYFQRAIQHQPMHWKAWLQLFKSYVTCCCHRSIEPTATDVALSQEPQS